MRKVCLLGVKALPLRVKRNGAEEARLLINK